MIQSGGVNTAMKPWVDCGAFRTHKTVVPHEIKVGIHAGRMGGHPVYKYLPNFARVWNPTVVLQCIGNEDVARKVLAERGLELELAPRHLRSLTPAPSPVPVPAKEQRPTAHGYTDGHQGRLFDDDRAAPARPQSFFGLELNEKGALIPYSEFPRFATLFAMFMQEERGTA
jgi:hypothetical protein